MNRLSLGGGVQPRYTHSAPLICIQGGAGGQEAVCHICLARFATEVGGEGLFPTL